MTIAAYVNGIGLLGPGLEDWPQAAAIFRGDAPYAPAATRLSTPQILPAAERRRTGRVVKLAIAIALEATQRAQVEPCTLASVFSSSGGDGHNCHEICEALTTPEREISPTRFSNSVHNAASGYWTIATGAKLESNVLCAYDASFSAGLLEALTQVAVDEQPLLLVTYDTEYPEPLHSKRPVPDAFGTALVLSPNCTATSLARIEASLTDAASLTAAADTLADARLESLRRCIPAARGLPLLRLLARGEALSTQLDYLETTRLSVKVEPCG